MVVHSDSLMRVLTSGWMSPMLCCTAARSICLRKPVLKSGPDLHTHTRCSFSLPPAEGAAGLSILPQGSQLHGCPPRQASVTRAGQRVCGKIASQHLEILICECLCGVSMALSDLHQNSGASLRGQMSREVWRVYSNRNMGLSFDVCFDLCSTHRPPWCLASGRAWPRTIGSGLAGAASWPTHRPGTDP